MARQFGIITNTSGGVTGIVVTDITSSTNVEKAEARNSQGKVTDVKAYSQSTSITIKGLLDAASASVEAGSTITVATKSYLVDSCEVTESNVNFAEVSIAASHADNATITPLISGGAV